jgi:mannose-6-phosphate isomerase-like protein (cupin superfamily)
VLPVIAGSPVQYCPFPGRIVGHPSVLEGSIDEIVASARALAAHDGVHGLDLLAYRFDGDVPALMHAVCAAVSKPVYIAGSIDTPERIAIVKQVGAAGFTIGTAALDGKYPAESKSVPDQLSAIIRDVARLNNHLSPFSKSNLSASFAGLPSAGAKIVPGTVNGMRIGLERLAGTSPWHFELDDDKLIFVHKGRLGLTFRDREETVGEGEFIVVPHGVEHRTHTPDGSCEAVIIGRVGHAERKVDRWRPAPPGALPSGARFRECQATWSSIRNVQCSTRTDFITVIEATRPVCGHSRRISAPSELARPCSNRLPKPAVLLSDGGGPPVSFHKRHIWSPAAETTTSIRPSSFESAPYFAAFVASSCRSRARSVTALPRTWQSSPLMLTRFPVE